MTMMIKGLPEEDALYIVIGLHPHPQRIKLLGTGNKEYVVNYTTNSVIDPHPYQGAMLRVDATGKIYSLKDGDAGKEEIISEPTNESG